MGTTKLGADLPGWLQKRCRTAKGHLPLTTLLLSIPSAAIKVNLRYRDGTAPLHRAIRGQHESVVTALLSCKETDVNLRDHSGRTPLHFAVRWGQGQTAGRFCLGINVHARHRDGQSPLAMAVQKDSMEVVRLLLEQEDIDINTRDHLGRTPLWWAVSRGNVCPVLTQLPKKRLYFSRLHYQYPPSGFISGLSPRTVASVSFKFALPPPPTLLARLSRSCKTRAISPFECPRPLRKFHSIRPS